MAKEDEVGQKLQEGGKGTEGAHYKDSQGISPVFDLADPSQTGAWTLSHPIYNEQEVNSVKVVWRTPQTVGDWIARGMVQLSRWGFDRITGYKHKERPAEKLSVEELRKGGYIFDDHQWLLRIIFLESIAGVPGMVAGMLRHLRSLRLMRRDGGWIHTLLEEAENERMHLLTFMTIKQPSILLRAMVLGAQGVFFNLFFLTYLFSPRSAHRFVGHLEEQATYTYTQCIKDMEEGLVPEWSDMAAPQIAIDYWRLPEDAKLLDVIKAVRLDECQHRIVNHTLANLDQKHDFNPFAFRELNADLAGTTVELTREQAAKFVTQVPPLPIAAEQAIEKAKNAPSDSA
ncbi:inducible alternative oxidase 2 [Naganishia albida]|nr:inducible alternative oxidase 2 [Naganishia albida]